MAEGALMIDAGTGEDLVVHHADGVAVITLNRPRHRNALTARLILGLRAAMTEADADDAIGAVILTGADPAFCAGLDLGEVAGSHATLDDPRGGSAQTSFTSRDLSVKVY